MVLICHCVARRLGLRCALAPYTSKRLALIWKKDYCAKKNRTKRFYINENAFQLYPSTEKKNQYEELPYDEVILHMLLTFTRTGHPNILYNWSLSILHQIMSLATTWVELQYSRITSIIENIYIEKDQPPKSRNKEAKFAIGMIVTHAPKHSRDTLENHDGVIIGWDYKRDIISFRNRVYNGLPYLSQCYNYFSDPFSCRNVLARYMEKYINTNQPYYMILLENNKICYVKEEDISLCPPKWIKNIEIGKYFSRFQRNYYVPNKRLAELYPNDMAAIQKIIFSSQYF
ncbi:uncharacterized protein [Anoplolepis gracilipes]|uniref:uncharacterized protein n=1 Tax=Anoplolepis gracilipes TaxID=354296 RepID=UPI003BA03552